VIVAQYVMVDLRLYLLATRKVGVSPLSGMVGQKIHSQMGMVGQNEAKYSHVQNYLKDPCGALLRRLIVRIA
jgi:hypothetical protein